MIQLVCNATSEKEIVAINDDIFRFPPGLLNGTRNLDRFTLESLTYTKVGLMPFASKAIVSCIGAPDHGLLTQ